MNKLIILDLDNCISDDGWRIPLIDWSQRDPDARYAQYHAHAALDLCRNSHAFTGRPAAVFTARPVSLIAETEDWLLRHGVMLQYLYMRQQGDHRSSPALKASMLAALLQNKRVLGPPSDLIEVAYDDRDAVLDAYRAARVNAKKLFIHNVCAFTPPAAGAAIQKEA